jgi:hypothetical protein
MGCCCQSAGELLFCIYNAAAGVGSVSDMAVLLLCLSQVWECRSRIARTLIASKCLTAFRVGVMQYLSLLWLCLMAFLGLNLGAKAAMVRWVAAVWLVA